MSKRAEELLELAQSEFGQLSTVEEQLFRSVAKGETADYTIGSQEIDNPVKADTWGEDRTVQSDRLIWLCTEHQVKKLVTFRGISLSGLKIQGEFSLNFARIDFPLSFSKCVFTHSFSLQQATLPRLEFEGSHVLAINATSIRIDGSLVLSKGFQSDGGVDLAGAIITGNIDCEGSKFINPRGDALRLLRVNTSHSILLRSGFEAVGRVNLYRAMIGGDLDCQNGKFVERDKYAILLNGAKVSGSILLRKNSQLEGNQTQGFQVNGLVLLYRATIGGNLECDGGKFINSEGDALIAESIDVKGDILLRNGFEANGRVSLVRAMIGGSIDCHDGKFINSQGDALNAEGIEIKGAALLRDGFEANGVVNLFRAVIGSNLECDGGKFINSQGDALIAEGIEVKGNILLRNGFEANGIVNLFGAVIGGNLVCISGKFINLQKNALNVEDIDVKGNVLLMNGFEANGGVSLCGAVIGGDLVCQNGKFIGRDNYAILLDGAKISGNVLLRKRPQVEGNQIQGFQSEGLVRLYRTSIGGNLECDGGKFINSQGFALNAEGIDVKGSVFLRDRFEADGRVSLRSSKIDGVLEIHGVQNPEKIIFFDLQFAKIRILHDAEDSWTQTGSTGLNNCVYDTISYSSPLDAKKRLEWLRLQQPKNGFSPQPYEHLAKVLRSLGHEDDAKEVLIAKQEDLRRYGKISIPERLWSLSLNLTISHGYKPHRVLLSALIFILVGTFLFDFGHSQGLISPSRFDIRTSTSILKSSQIPNYYPKFNAFVYSLDLFLPIVDLRQKNYWQPNLEMGGMISLKPSLKIQWEGIIVQCYFWVHILLGWLLTTLWVAGVTGLVRRLN